MKLTNFDCLHYSTDRANIYQKLQNRVEETNHLLVDITKDKVKQVAERLPKEFYGKAVENLIISCVDVFVYDPETRKYLLVKRGQKPSQGTWHVPGGRQNKGESFFEAAIRKCKEELSIDIIPMKNLTNYGTIFPDSEWGAQTHTNNQVIFATIQPGSNPDVDHNHEGWRWLDISKSPANSDFFTKHDINRYVQLIYDEAIGVIRDQETNKVGRSGLQGYAGYAGKLREIAMKMFGE